LKFTFSTGSPFTLYNPDGSQSVSLYNTERLTPYHASDVRVDRRWYFDKWTLITYLDIQNITNRKNSTSVRWDPQTQTVDNQSSIGILPSIGVSLEF